MALLLGFKKSSEGGVTDACGQVYSLSTGALFDTLKHSFENALEISSIDYSPQHRSFFGVDRKTNHVFAWSLQRKNRKYLTFNIGAKPHLLCLSPCGTFCAAAVGSNIYVWQVTNGNLLCVLSGHFQPISVLKFTDDARFLLSGGEDGLILVWDLANSTAMPDIGPASSSNDQRPPLFKWNEHSQSITGIAVGHGGIHARIFSCSLDHSFRIWDLLCGRLLLTISFDVPLTGLAIDASETRAFLATESGRIVQVNLFAPPSSSSVVNTGSIQSFDGHQSPCRNLAVSSDGLTLVSCGSTASDKNVRIWDVVSRQCLRVVKVKGEITEMRLLDHVPPGYDNETSEHSDSFFCGTMKPFHRNVTSLKVFTLTASGRFDKSFDEEEVGDLLPSVENNPALVENSAVQPASDSASLTDTNRRLYDFMVSRILSGELGGRASSSLNNSRNDNNNGDDDVIIVEHSGEEEDNEEENAGKRRKGALKRTIQKRRSNRLRMKNRRKNGLGDPATVLD